MNRIINIIILTGIFSISNVVVGKALSTSVSEGDIINVTLSELVPTQFSIGFDQIFYKLGRFDKDKKKMFDEICKTNGQKGIASFNKHSTAHDPQTFSCKKTVGTVKKEMKTVVIAPNGRYYLTDGHHTLNVFWAMSEGGSEFKVNVIVDKDYRNLNSMDSFWKQMVSDGNTWLFDQQGNPLTYHNLPASLGMENFANDQYRSLVYFSRNVAWSKPKISVPFLEFYWATELYKQLDIAQLDLNSKSGYEQAIMKVSHVILALESNDVGRSGKSVKEMGQFSQLNQKGLDKLLRAKKGKISYMINYKNNL